MCEARPSVTYSYLLRVIYTWGRGGAVWDEPSPAGGIFKARAAQSYGTCTCQRISHVPDGPHPLSQNSQCRNLRYGVWLFKFKKIFCLFWFIIPQANGRSSYCSIGRPVIDSSYPAARQKVVYISHTSLKYAVITVCELISLPAAATCHRVSPNVLGTWHVSLSWYWTCHM